MYSAPESSNDYQEQINNKGQSCQAAKQVQSLTEEEEETLWDNGQLGDEAPYFFISTVCWLLKTRLQSRQEQNLSLFLEV